MVPVVFPLDLFGAAVVVSIDISGNDPFSFGDLLRRVRTPIGTGERMRRERRCRQDRDLDREKVELGSIRRDKDRKL